MAGFDGSASMYDADFSRSPLGVLLRDAVHRELPFQPGQRILDLGCGTGEDAVRLLDRGIDVYGIDESRAMIENASAKCTGGGTFVVADLERSPLPAVHVRCVPGPCQCGPAFWVSLHRF